MDNRTTRTLVTFRRPFALSALAGVQPAGSYTIRTEEERLDTLTIEAWRQTGCIIVLGQGGTEEHIDIDPQELRDAGPEGSTSTVPVDRSRRPRDLLRRGGRP